MLLEGDRARIPGLCEVLEREHQRTETLANLVMLTSSTNKREEFLVLLDLENKAYRGG